MSDAQRAPDDEPSLRDAISAAMGANAAGPADDAPQTPSEPEPPAGDEPRSVETIAPPAAWSATAKARFQSLDPVIQQEVLKREKDMEQGKAQWDQKGERLNRLDAILNPRREKLRLAGMDDARAIEALFAAQDLLERDPVSGVGYLARHYGVDPSRLVQGGQGQAEASPPPMHPAIQHLAQQVGSLQSAFAQQQAEARRTGLARHAADIQAFRDSGDHPFFDNVAGHMAELVQSGRAGSLKDAYDAAVWANPETRTLLIQREQDQRRTEAEAAARAKADAARHAAGSITGSPQPGASPALAGPAPTLRDELARAFSNAS